MWVANEVRHIPRVAPLTFGGYMACWLGSLANIPWMTSMLTLTMLSSPCTNHVILTLYEQTNTHHVVFTHI